MLGRAYPRYNVSNANELGKALRRAAMMGEPQDIKFMQEHVSKLNIDAAGTDTGLTALHQASKHGKSAAMNFLLAHGADPYKIDSFKKNAFDYAKESGNAESIQALQLFDLAKKASLIAKKRFPEPPSRPGSPDFANVLGKVTTMVTEELQEIKKHLIKLGNQYLLSDDEVKELKKNNTQAIPQYLTMELIEKQYLPAINTIFYYFKGIISLYYTLHISQQENFRKAYCDTIAAMVFLCVWKMDVKVERFHVFANNVNHAFVVLNRKEGSKETDPDTWGAGAYFINDNGEVYAVAYRPHDSILNVIYAYHVNVYGNKAPSSEELILDEAKKYVVSKEHELRARINSLTDSKLLQESAEDKRWAAKK